MKTFAKWFEENYNEKLPEGSISGDWFEKHHLPMIVRCSCCDMSMALPSACIDAAGRTYCKECVEPW